MDTLRAIAAAAALTSIAMLIVAVALFADSGSDSATDEVAGTEVAQQSTGIANEPTVAPTSAVTATAAPEPTPREPSEPAAEPASSSVTVVELATPEPVPEPTTPASPGLGQWCTGPRPVDVLLAPVDGAEVIGQLEPDVCGLEQLAEPQQGWVAIRSGSGLDLLEGWVWGSELVASEN